MAKRKRAMTDDDVASAVTGQIDDARAFAGSDVDTIREKALKFFEGEVDIPTLGPGRSTVVSRDVADTHGLILPGLLRVFFSSARIVLYEPTRKEHEEYATLASDLVNYVVMRECDGYRHFRNAISDGLLIGNGIVKHWWDDTPEYTTETFTGLTEDQFRMIAGETDVEEILDHEEYPDPDYKAPAIPPQLLALAGAAGAMGAPMMPGMPPIAPMGFPGDLEAMQGPSDDIEDKQTGETKQRDDEDADPNAPKLHDFTVKRLRSKGRLRIAALPSEEFIMGRNETVLDETVRFCAHVRPTTRSELVKEGYPRAKVDKIPYETEDALDRGAKERGGRDATYNFADAAPDKSTERVTIYECYVLLDTDGDGIAERRRVVMGGHSGKRAILSNEEWGDNLPFSDIVPNPRAHSWRGKGLYEEVGDLQRIKTAVLRSLMDNTYRHIAPQREMEEGAYLNMDEVVSPTPDGVLIRRSGAQPMTPVAVPYIGDKMFPVLEYMDAVGEKRTGASQRSQALDMDALQNQSATAVNAAMAATYTVQEEYARNIAECGGFRRIFGCCLKLITKHQDRAKSVRLHGKLVEIDPRSWQSDMDVTINTGLGTGSRDKDVAVISAIAAKQEAAIAQFGPYNEKLNIGHLMESYQQLAEAAGVRNPESYFPTITQEEVTQVRQAMESQPKPVDPKVAEAQAKLQLRQAEVQFEQQAEFARFQAEQQAKGIERQQDAEIRQAQLLVDAENRAREAELKLQLQRDEAAARLQLLREETAARIEIARAEMAAKQDARYAELEIENRLAELAMLLKAGQSNTNIPRPE